MIFNLKDKLKGCFMGMAIGDAMGSPVEFLRPGEFEVVTGFRSGGIHKVRSGEWTDDTSMALAIADALIQREGDLDLELILDNFLAWFEKGTFSSRGICFDIGNTTKKALVSYKTESSLMANTKSFYESGNGSLMRMSPLFCAYKRLTLETALAVSRTTHASPTVDDYVERFTRLIGDILDGSGKDELSEKYEFMVNSEPTGFVVDSYNVAVCSFFKTKSFAEGLLLTVNQGHDADTVGAIYGQIAGAFYGASSIPLEWREGLHQKEMLEKVYDELWRIRK